MSDDTERSVASAGSQPVAWSVDWDGEIDCDFVYRDRESAMDVIADNDETSGVVVPLYRQPQPTLTDEERHAIAVVRNCAMTRAERFLTQSDAEREATLVLWRLRERLG